MGKNNVKLTTEEFIFKAKQIHGNKYDYSLVEYNGNKIKVKIICPEHGIFEQSPNSHLMLHGCLDCSGLKRLTTRMFIEKSKKIHGDKYDYSLVEYENITKKVKIICFEHGMFLQTPSEHFNGSGCQICSGTKKRNTDEFILKSKEIHGDKYEYSLVDYINSKTNVKLICKKHGEFEITPNVHYLGDGGCKKCADNSKKLKIEDFIDRSNSIHDNKYNYSLVDYINCKTKIKIVCPEHGIFEQTPRTHLLGRGCPICSESKGEKKITRILKNSNIKFDKQKTFENCKDKNKLAFDFYIPDINTCIEYDGKQHFEPIEWFGGLPNFIITKKHDEIKNLYCKDNNIKILRISYVENIEEKLKEIYEKF